MACAGTATPSRQPTSSRGACEAANSATGTDCAEVASGRRPEQLLQGDDRVRGAQRRRLRPAADFGSERSAAYQCRPPQSHRRRATPAGAGGRPQETEFQSPAERDGPGADRATPPASVPNQSLPRTTHGAPGGVPQLPRGQRLHSSELLVPRGGLPPGPQRAVAAHLPEEVRRSGEGGRAAERVLPHHLRVAPALAHQGRQGGSGVERQVPPGERRHLQWLRLVDGRSGHPRPADGPLPRDVPGLGREMERVGHARAPALGQRQARGRQRRAAAAVPPKGRRRRDLVRRPQRAWRLAGGARVPRARRPHPRGPGHHGRRSVDPDASDPEAVAPEGATRGAGGVRDLARLLAREARVPAGARALPQAEPERLRRAVRQQLPQSGVGPLALRGGKAGKTCLRRGSSMLILTTVNSRVSVRPRGERRRFHLPIDSIIVLGLPVSAHKKPGPDPPGGYSRRGGRGRARGLSKFLFCHVPVQRCPARKTGWSAKGTRERGVKSDAARMLRTLLGLAPLSDSPKKTLNVERFLAVAGALCERMALSPAPGLRISRMQPGGIRSRQRPVFLALIRHEGVKPRLRPVPETQLRQGAIARARDPLLPRDAHGPLNGLGLFHHLLGCGRLLRRICLVEGAGEVAHADAAVGLAVIDGVQHMAEILLTQQHARALQLVTKLLRRHGVALVLGRQSLDGLHPSLGDLVAYLRTTAKMRASTSIPQRAPSSMGCLLSRQALSDVACWHLTLHGAEVGLQLQQPFVLSRDVGRTEMGRVVGRARLHQLRPPRVSGALQSVHPVLKGGQVQPAAVALVHQAEDGVQLVVLQLHVQTGQRRPQLLGSQQRVTVGVHLAESAELQAGVVALERVRNPLEQPLMQQQPCLVVAGVLRVARQAGVQLPKIHPAFAASRQDGFRHGGGHFGAHQVGLKIVQDLVRHVDAIAPAHAKHFRQRQTSAATAVMALQGVHEAAVVVAQLATHVLCRRRQAALRRGRQASRQLRRLIRRLCRRRQQCVSLGQVNPAGAAVVDGLGQVLQLRLLQVQIGIVGPQAAAEGGVGHQAVAVDVVVLVDLVEVWSLRAQRRDALGEAAHFLLLRVLRSLHPLLGLALVRCRRLQESPVRLDRALQRRHGVVDVRDAVQDRVADSQGVHGVGVPALVLECRAFV
eukprot:scaffold57_cov254-Pinguiococcus_pyrenoidosus.AAC.36